VSESRAVGHDPEAEVPGSSRLGLNPKSYESQYAKKAALLSEKVLKLKKTIKLAVYRPRQSREIVEREPAAQRIDPCNTDAYPGLG